MCCAAPGTAPAAVACGCTALYHAPSAAAAADAWHCSSKVHHRLSRGSCCHKAWRTPGNCRLAWQQRQQRQPCLHLGGVQQSWVMPKSFAGGYCKPRALLTLCTPTSINTHVMTLSAGLSPLNLSNGACIYIAQLHQLQWTFLLVQSSARQQASTIRTKRLLDSTRFFLCSVYTLTLHIAQVVPIFTGSCGRPLHHLPLADILVPVPSFMRPGSSS